MTWEQVIALIIRYGIEGTYAIVKVINDHETPTKEAWDKLLALGLKPYDQYIKEARERAGLPPLAL